MHGPLNAKLEFMLTGFLQWARMCTPLGKNTNFLHSYLTLI